MGVVLFGLAVAAFILAYPAIKYRLNGSSEAQREEDAYNELMDCLKAEASQYTGREISEEEILEVGRRYGEYKKRTKKK